MELRPGYKQTEVGIIPEDWDVKLLPDACRFRSGKAHEQFISEAGRFVCVNSKFISTDGSVRKFSTENFCPAKKGDILMVMSDLPNGRALAKAYLVEANDIYAVNQRVCALTAYHDCPDFLFYILNRHPYFLKFDDGVSQTHLLNQVFLKCQIPVPRNVSEQTAIATALGDVDALLVAQDALVAKKRAIKQGAMQGLLTGKRRLPGFNEKWEIKALSDVADVIDPHPSHRAPREVSHGVPFLGIGDLDEAGNIIGKRLRRVDPSVLAEHATRYNLNDQLIGLGRVASIGKVVSLEALADEIAISPTLGIIRGREAMRSYLLYALRSTFITNQFSQIMSGSTRSSVGMEVLRKLKVMLPPSGREQTAIAETLSDMDAEITTLDIQRSKTAQLKQGMMQALLTGRIRLV